MDRTNYFVTDYISGLCLDAQAAIDYILTHPVLSDLPIVSKSYTVLEYENLWI